MIDKITDIHTYMYVFFPKKKYNLEHLNTYIRDCLVK